MEMIQRLYNKSPIFLQNLLCSIKGYKESKLRFGKRFDEYYNFLIESQFWSKQKIEEYQNEKLNFIINYSYNNSVYYKELLDSFGFSPKNFTSISDIKKLPLLTKEIVRERYDDLLVKEFHGKVVHSHTSGSTGKALDFCISADAIKYRWALWFRHKQRFGITPNDAYATFTGLPAIPLNQANPPFWRENLVMKQTIFTMHHITPDKVKYIVERLNKGCYAYYSGYPSILNNLATLIQDCNLKITAFPKVIFTGAETLYEDQRERISDVFHCIVTDQYGFSEGAGNASKCEQNFFHEDFEYGILETNNEIKNGIFRTGEIIATGFTNLAMPFIRYKVGDIGTWVDKECCCGRKSKILQKIEGRHEDYIITPEGSKIMRFDYIFKDTKDIKESQVVQYIEGEITIKIVKRINFSINTQSYILSAIKEKVSPNLKVNIEYVDEILKENNGKYRAVKSFL